MTQMPNLDNMHAQMPTVAADATLDERVDFIRKTYLHLFGAILAFVGLEVVLFQIPFMEKLMVLMMSSGFSWLIVLGLFMVGSFIANALARSEAGALVQYAGLAFYVLLESIIFFPLLYIAAHYGADFGGVHIIAAAGGVTLLIFATLTAVNFITRADFSFLRGILIVCTIAAFAAIVLGLLVPSLGLFGTLFSALMVVLACGYILYTTSRIIHDYRTDQHIGASLELFACVALLFWYVLQLFLSRE